MLVWIGLVDVMSNITCGDYNNSSLAVLCICPVKQKLRGWEEVYVCQGRAGHQCVCVPPRWLLQCIGSPLSVSAGLCDWKALDYVQSGANGSVDKKSSLLPQIHRLNAASRAIAALRANGSENTTLRELWLNPSVTAEPGGNIWAKRLHFKSNCTSLAFKYIRVIQRLWAVLLTWYLNWKVNPVLGQLTRC